MKRALIDIGSNTIRLVIYDNDEIVLNKASFSGLISYVANGELSDDGFKHLCDVLNEMRTIAIDNRCNSDKIIPFATASLRGVTDKEKLIALVEQATSLKMQIITGDAEAEYDYIGLKNAHDFSEGVAFDLGGGSCQLIIAGDGRVIKSASMPIGSQKLYNDLVISGGIIPNESEREAISNASRDALTSNFDSSIIKPTQYVYAMGGAAKEITNMLGKLLQKDMPIVAIDELDLLLSLPEATIAKLAPDRAKTIIPAILTIKEILYFANSDKIYITMVGVREGIIVCV